VLAVPRTISTATHNQKFYVELRCQWCIYGVDLEVDQRAFDDWQRGKFIQDAFPELSAGLRELFISGTCDWCWDKMFPPEEDDDAPHSE